MTLDLRWEDHPQEEEQGLSCNFLLVLTLVIEVSKNYFQHNLNGLQESQL